MVHPLLLFSSSRRSCYCKQAFLHRKHSSKNFSLSLGHNCICMLAFKNCKFFANGLQVAGHNVLIDGGDIVKISTDEIPAAYEIVDATGGYLSPGFIDL